MNITEPGIYPDIPEADYHAHPALSASQMKKLLPPYVPAIFKHERDHGQPSKHVFNFGRAAHAELLGIGSEMVVVKKVARDKTVVDAGDYDTKSAQQHVEEILAEGKTPILRHEIAVIEQMVAAVRADPLASKLLAPSDGTAEASMFWADPETGVPLRGRLDFLRRPNDSGRLLLPDYKTAASCDPREFAAASARFGYPISAANYIDGLTALDYADEIEFLFVVQMKTAPYLVSVVGITPDDLERGRALKRKAVHTFQTCTERDEWPGYSQEVHYPDLPTWWQYQTQEIVA